MLYADARPLIKSGDLLAFSHRGWGSWRDIKIQIVRFFTQSEYSHVGTAWVIGDRVFVIEAVIPKVRIYPLSKLLPFYHLPLNAPWYPRTLELALSKVGEPYSQVQAIKAFFSVPTPDTYWQCAELALAIAASDDIGLGYKATPTAVVNAALVHGSTLTLVT